MNDGGSGFQPDPHPVSMDVQRLPKTEWARRPYLWEPAQIRLAEDALHPLHEVVSNSRAQDVK